MDNTKSPLYSPDSLHNCKDATQLIDSHDDVVRFWGPYMEKRERCDDFVRGNHWTEEEQQTAESKHKALVTFNYLKPSERTFVGALIQNRYDIKPAPTEPLDQNKSDIYTAMYHLTADQTRVKYYDPGLIRSAWAGGNAWQESYIIITPGRKPRIVVKNQNNYAIYPDPNRKDLVTNSDCEFIDRVSWLTANQIADAFPDKEAMVLGVLDKGDETSDYQDTKIYADRTHESENYRNGRYKVIERFYRVKKKRWYGVTDGEETQLGYDLQYKEREAIQEDYPAMQLNAEAEEYLYLAIACPQLSGEFLYNGEYHCQLRDPATKKIMFPLVELVDEDLNGEPSGHVEHQIDSLRLTNSLLVNKLHQAKTSAGQSHVVSRDHFDETEIDDVINNHADGGRSFKKRKGAPDGSGVSLIEQGRSSIDADTLINFANSFRQETSSTPPSMQGLSEGATSGILNEQRIQQSSVQSQVFITNYMNFLITRAKLWKAYWQKYWTANEVIRVLEQKDKNSPQWIEINQIVQDEFGNHRQENTFEDGDFYDITFEDSWKSPTVRDKVRKQISELLQGASVQQDPVLATFLTQYLLHLTDAPQEMKDLMEEHSTIIKQAKAQEQQAQQQEQQMALQGQEMDMQGKQLDQMAKTQEIASNEAQATVPPLAPQSMALEMA